MDLYFLWTQSHQDVLITFPFKYYDTLSLQSSMEPQMFCKTERWDLTESLSDWFQKTLQKFSIKILLILNVYAACNIWRVSEKSMTKEIISTYHLKFRHALQFWLSEGATVLWVGQVYLKRRWNSLYILMDKWLCVMEARRVNFQKLLVTTCIVYNFKVRCTCNN